MIISIAITIVVLILIADSYRKRTKNEKAKQLRQAKLKIEQEARDQHAENLRKQYQFEKERQENASLEKQQVIAENKAKTEKELARQNTIAYKLRLSECEKTANSENQISLMPEVIRGKIIRFECTGDCKIITSTIKNCLGDNIVGAYAMGKVGYRLMLNADFNPKDFAAGTVLSVVLTENQINGKKWLSLANEEEIKQQNLIEIEEKLEKDRQSALQWKQTQADKQKQQVEQDQIPKQKQIAEQKRQMSEKEVIEKDKIFLQKESAKYVGEYKNGKIHGEGTLIYSDGKKYVGEFYEGYKEGYGILSFTDGSVYEGNFKKDQYNGYGQFLKPNGEIIEGEFSEGDFVSNLIGKNVIKNELKPFYLFFDTETTGLPDNSIFEYSYSGSSYLDENDKLRNLLNTPRLVRLSYLVFDKNGNQIAANDFIIKPVELIPISVSNIHGITTERAKKEGVSLKPVLEHFRKLIDYVKIIIGHNISFDIEIISTEFLRNGIRNSDRLENKTTIDTMTNSIEYCGLKNKYGLKFPKLSELHFKLFQKEFEEVHDSTIDVEITAKCFWELKRIGVIE